ncbi:kinesin-like protein KIN-4A [Musa acuminata AAA Group]|uniref:kinesin-like protein KIN-4A n=1 Tax=Musa acuminata AAA Group TaxID=214697 RepID=UPI0031D21278
MAYSGMQEGHYVTHPPIFNGSDNTYWKTRMRIFLISMDFELWNIVKNRFQKSSLPMAEWDELEKKLLTSKSLTQKRKRAATIAALAAVADGSTAICMQAGSLQQQPQGQRCNQAIDEEVNAIKTKNERDHNLPKGREPIGVKACISPADINAEETLNTLKYANRARNIENKPIVNRNPISDEILRMHQHIEYLQAELACSRGVGTESDEVQTLKERISWLEATNEDLCRKLCEYHGQQASEHFERDFQKGRTCFVKAEGLKRSLQSTESLHFQLAKNLGGDSSKEFDEEIAKEWEYEMLQDSMGKELNELNRQLEQKESEMKTFGGCDTLVLKQHFGKKLMELEEEKRTVQQERDRLLSEVENLSANSDGQTHKLPDDYLQKLKTLEAQIINLKKKQENQVQLLKQKQRSDEAAKKLQDEIQFIKAQKVQLQHKIKQEAEQFRQWKASREKELLQLRKEGRRNEYERRKLQALNQRQKMVLQRKTEEAAMATKKLKEMLEARKSSARENPVIAIGNSAIIQINEKSLQQWLDHEVEVLVHMHEVRDEYEKQCQMYVNGCYFYLLIPLL